MQDNYNLQNGPDKIVRERIIIIRGHKVMLDVDLAELYEVETKAFNQAVKRNHERFPMDFMFRITKEEKDEVVTNCDHLTRLKFSHSLPYAFTEHGVAMLSAILNSKNAVLTSIFIVRAFIKMRESLDNYRNLDTRVNKIEQKQKEDSDILYDVYSIVKHITEQPISLPGKIGFNE